MSIRKWNWVDSEIGFGLIRKSRAVHFGKFGGAIWKTTCFWGKADVVQELGGGGSAGDVKVTSGVFFAGPRGGREKSPRIV